jgi:hypothetical protein
MFYHRVFTFQPERHMDFHIFNRAKMLTRVLQRASTNNFSPIYNSVSNRNYFCPEQWGMVDTGSIKKIIKASLEGMLDAELTEHLGYEKYSLSGGNN